MFSEYKVFKPSEDDLHNISESSPLEMTANRTHQGCHFFTAPTWLGAKEPDHWTTCNTVEYEGALLLKSQPYKMGPEIFMKEITVPKNMALSDCRAVEFIVSIAIAESSMNSRLRSGN